MRLKKLIFNIIILIYSISLITYCTGNDKIEKMRIDFETKIWNEYQLDNNQYRELGLLLKNNTISSGKDIDEKYISEIFTATKNIESKYNLSKNNIYEVIRSLISSKHKINEIEKALYMLDQFKEDNLNEINIINIIGYLSISENNPNDVMDAVVDIVSLIEKAPNEISSDGTIVNEFMYNFYRLKSTSYNIVEFLVGIISSSHYNSKIISNIVINLTCFLEFFRYEVSKDDIITTTQRICYTPDIELGLEGAVRDFIETHISENNNR